MYFKLSNTAEMKVMESEANALFKYPNLYTPQIVISGLSEVSIPILTMEDPNVISLSIWGLLPSNYTDDWELFQNLTNTLNINSENLDSGLWYTKAFENRRCLIPVTGFYTSVLNDGQINPYYIGPEKENLIYLAGMYTVLEDGFITCTILTGPLDDYLGMYQNLVNFMPLIINPKHKDLWLSGETSVIEAKRLLKSSHNVALQAKPIEKALFNQDISYDSMLMPFDSTEN
ncbi:SOS response-associated peptidase [Maribacter sp. X9]|uniref:SOS response-associated peptidase n=1 Tax=Maribacter sp. X9 TaxID=3402159 RepID=UPI003AF3C2AD